jgi:hypothetical protein
MTTATTPTTTRLALGAAFAALCFGAAACGSETTADPAASLNQAGTQQQSRISPRAAEQQDLAARERAQRADARRWGRGHHQRAEHPPGYFHAETQCRHQRRSSDSLLCTSTSPSQAPLAARPVSYKLTDLLP